MLQVAALVDVKRTPVVQHANLNVGGKTSLVVKPLDKGDRLGVAVVSDWTEGEGELSVDYAVEITWDGKQAAGKELTGDPAWATK